jgi:hypothetical protein
MRRGRQETGERRPVASSRQKAGNRTGLAVAVALLALCALASAAFYSQTLLFDTPTADVLPAGSMAISADVTGPLTETQENIGWWEGDASIRFSPVKGLDIGVTAYTLTDYVLDAKFRILGGPGRFSLALGVSDIGLHEYVSPIGHDTANAWPDWQYWKDEKYIRPYENLSAFVVASIPLRKIARLHLGLGRGRFVGYDGPNEYLNTDIFLDEYHQWAVALFGGLEVYVMPNVALVVEANTRDLNSGIKAKFGPLTAAVAWTKMEGLLRASGADDPRRFGRIDVGASCQFDRIDLSGLSRLIPRREPFVPIEPVPPPPLPEPTAVEPVAAPSPGELKLEPIWFEWDKWDITPEAAATLHRNADKLLAYPNVRVVITGYASEEGTLEHNFPLSGRRAHAASEYLKSLGVPAGQLRFRALGESAGRPYPPHRAVYFEIETEK